MNRSWFDNSTGRYDPAPERETRPDKHQLIRGVAGSLQAGRVTVADSGAPRALRAFHVAWESSGASFEAWLSYGALTRRQAQQVDELDLFLDPANPRTSTRAPRTSC
jgi:hypothetical protein